MANDTEERGALCLAVKAAFEHAGVGAIIQDYPMVPYATVKAYINHNSGWHTLGLGWQRQALAFIRDDREEVHVYMTGLYRVPDGKTGQDVASGEQIPLLFTLSRRTPGWFEEVVSRVRLASQANTDTIEVAVIQPPPPPVALEELATLGDLIDVYEKFYFTDQYHAWLMAILSKLGKVHHRHDEWFIDFSGHLCHTETAPTSAAVTGPDGEPVIYTNAAYIRLDAYRDLICEPR